MKFTYDFAEIEGRVPMIDFLDSLSVKEQKTPKSEIEKAKTIRKLWRGEK